MTGDLLSLVHRIFPWRRIKQVLVKKIIWISAIAFITFSIPCVCFAQASGVGSINSGLVKGGAGSSALVSKLSSLVDPGIFNRMANKPKKTAAVKRNSASRPNSKSSKPVKARNLPGDSAVLADASVLNFRPNGNSGADQTFADLLSQDEDVNQALLLIFSETKKAYDIEAAKQGRKNDLALAMTFFITTAVTVHNDAPEPSDAATENLYQALAESMRESKEIAQMSNKDKQTASDTLVYVSGLILAGYVTSKQGDDQATLSIYRQAAADTLHSLTGISADKMEFNKTGLNFKP
jgi:hypothetical protein